MLTLKLIGSVILNVAFFAGLLFIPAGTFHWWRHQLPASPQISSHFSPPSTEPVPFPTFDLL
jgi:hypothetical protein